MSGLHLQRCRNHPEREAAVRCPGCSRFFCRECAGEHEGRLLCAGCLAARVRRVERAVRGWGWFTRPMQWALGFLVAWWVFGFAGRVLTEVPDEFHEGTYWRFLEGLGR
jgi:hypothetical protein